MNIKKNIMYGSIAVIITALALAFTACDDVTNLTKSNLNGNVRLNNDSPKVGDIITAAYEPGNGTGAQTWQWFRTDGTDVLVEGVAGSTYTVTAADEGKKIKVRLSFADQIGSVSATTTNAVTAANPLQGGDITYTVEQTGGVDGDADSTGIVFTFSASVDSLGLTADNIAVGEKAAKAADAVLTGEGNSRTLPITVNGPGEATVHITKTGIAAGTQHVTVHKKGQSTPVLTKIEADFDPDGATIYTSTPLNKLKDFLTVKAIYSNNDKETLDADEYSLSCGSDNKLTVGTDVAVTVTYKNKTTSFNVTVTAAPECDCVNKVHPHGSPCTCPAKGTPACTCTEAGPPGGDPECDCASKVHPYGDPCDCEAEGTPACTCVEDEPECDCIVKVHPLGSPCDCPLAGTDACDCTEEGEPLKFTVYFDANDGVTPHTHIQVTEGGKAIKPSPDPARANYAFVYWFDSETDLEWDFDTVITAEITLKAKWAYQSFMDMVLVGSGSFQMGQQNGVGGSLDVGDVHTVTLTSDFYIGKFEVTQKEYATVMGSLPSVLIAASNGRGDNYPVYHVSWYDALVFCNKLSMLEELTPAYSIDGKTDPAEWGTVPTTSTATWNAVTVVANSTGYRLPTEAQWEYAAKGGPLATVPYFTYSGSNAQADVAVFNTASAGPATVGSKTAGTYQGANQLGIKDMSGNVAEWVWDWHSDSGYNGYDEVFDPTGLLSGSDRVIRGGSYTIGTAVIQLRNLRCVARLGIAPQNATNNYLGFRIARPVVE